MTTYVLRNGELVPKRMASPPGGQPSAYVISDDLPPMRHPITGKLMDSKSEFRAVTRAHGCVEVGNDQQRDTRKFTDFDTASRKADILRAISELGG